MKFSRQLFRLTTLTVCFYGVLFLYCILGWFVCLLLMANKLHHKAIAFSCYRLHVYITQSFTLSVSYYTTLSCVTAPSKLTYETVHLGIVPSPLLRQNGLRVKTVTANLDCSQITGGLSATEGLPPNHYFLNFTLLLGVVSLIFFLFLYHGHSNLVAISWYCSQCCKISCNF